MLAATTIAVIVLAPGCAKKGADAAPIVAAQTVTTAATPACLNLADLVKSVRALPADSPARVQLVDLAVALDGGARSADAPIVEADDNLKDAAVAASFSAKDEPVVETLGKVEVEQQGCDKLSLRDTDGVVRPQRVLATTPTSIVYAPVLTEGEGVDGKASVIEKTTIEMPTTTSVRIVRVRYHSAQKKLAPVRVTSTQLISWSIPAAGQKGETVTSLLPATQPISDRLAKMIAGYFERHSPKRKLATEPGC